MGRNMYSWIKLKYHKDNRGILMAIQDNTVKDNNLPMRFKRIFILSKLNPKKERGNHTLKTTTQAFFCLKGSCEIELDDGFKRKKLKLNQFNKGLLVYPMVWRTLKNFSKDAIILVIADKTYKESDYIRNYENFIQQVRRGIQKI